MGIHITYSTRAHANTPRSHCQLPASTEERRPYGGIHDRAMQGESERPEQSGDTQARADLFRDPCRDREDLGPSPHQAKRPRSRQLKPDRPIDGSARLLNVCHAHRHPEQLSDIEAEQRTANEVDRSLGQPWCDGEGIAQAREETDGRSKNARIICLQEPFVAGVTDMTPKLHSITMLLEESNDAPHVGGHEQEPDTTVNDDHAVRAVRPGLFILRVAVNETLRWV
mmetsp:Transcript_71081/g.230757  ORF Transcript_71081/g.230757 Transcript_71081/m.230757 type:complete len:226 (-) Transcript_71081:113-790(-)